VPVDICNSTVMGMQDMFDRGLADEKEVPYQAGRGQIQKVRERRRRTVSRSTWRQCILRGRSVGSTVRPQRPSSRLEGESEEFPTAPRDLL